MRLASGEGLAQFDFSFGFLCHHSRTCLFPSCELIRQLKLLCNSASYGFCVIFHILVCESKHFPAELFEILLSLNVSFYCLIVTAAIDFHNQHLFYARKISDPWIDRMLSSKFQTAQLIRPQDAPEQAF